MVEKARPLPAFDPDLLEKPLPTGDGSGLDPTDPRLEGISDLVFRNNYAEAAIRVQEIWESGCVDARLLGYYLLGIFIEDGIAGFPALFRSATKALTTQWSGFVPADRKVALADANLAWLFEHLLKRLRRHEELADDQWKAWWNRGDIDVALMDSQTTAKPLEEALAAALPGRKALARLQRLRRWLDEAVTATAKPVAPPAKAQKVTPVEPEEPEEESEAEMEEEEEEVERSDRGGNSRRGGGGDLANESPAMAILLRKLQAFQQLVKRGDFQKAAVISLDLEAIMANFDPRVYFPALFAPYFSALHEHAEELEPAMSDPESFTARTLAQLYRVDLEAFLRGR